MGSVGQDSIKVLIELLGLKYLTHESDDGKALWHALVDEPRVYEARQREIELLFDKKEWEARSLLFMLKTMRNTDLVGHHRRHRVDQDLDRPGLRSEAKGVLLRTRPRDPDPALDRLRCQVLRPEGPRPSHPDDHPGARLHEPDLVHAVTQRKETTDEQTNHPDHHRAYLSRHILSWIILGVHAPCGFLSAASTCRLFQDD